MGIPFGPSPNQKTMVGGEALTTRPPINLHFHLFSAMETARAHVSWAPEQRSDEGIVPTHDLGLAAVREDDRLTTPRSRIRLPHNDLARLDELSELDPLPRTPGLRKLPECLGRFRQLVSHLETPGKLRLKGNVPERSISDFTPVGPRIPTSVLLLRSHPLQNLRRVYADQYTRWVVMECSRGPPGNDQLEEGSCPIRLGNRPFASNRDWSSSAIVG